MQKEGSLPKVMTMRRQTTIPWLPLLISTLLGVAACTKSNDDSASATDNILGSGAEGEPCYSVVNPLYVARGRCDSGLEESWYNGPYVAGYTPDPDSCTCVKMGCKVSGRLQWSDGSPHALGVVFLSHFPEDEVKYADCDGNFTFNNLVCTSYFLYGLDTQNNATVDAHTNPSDVVVVSDDDSYDPDADCTLVDR